MLAKIQRKKNPCAQLMEMEISAATVENSMENSILNSKNLK